MKVRKGSKEQTERVAPDVAYLTLDEAAIEARCCRKTLEKFILLRELRVTRIGRKVLVSREQLHKFLQLKTK